MSVSGVVVTHGPDPDIDNCLAALRPQVDELVVVANPPAPEVDARLIVNDRALGFAANANQGIAATTAPYVVMANPDTEPREDAVDLLRSSSSHDVWSSGSLPRLTTTRKTNGKIIRAMHIARMIG